MERRCACAPCILVMSGRTVAIVWPSLQTRLLNLPDHVVIDERGVWRRRSLEVDFGTLLSGASAERRTTSGALPWIFQPERNSGESGIEMVSKSWRQWLSIFSRYADRGDQFDLWFSDMAFRVQRLASLLGPVSLAGAIFHTGVSHHVETMLLQQALSLANVPQVFPYSLVISGRLLPLAQRHDVADRRPLGAQISSYSADSDISHFVGSGAEVPNFAVDGKASMARRAKLAFRMARRAAIASGSEVSGGEALRLSRHGTYGLETYLRQSRQSARALSLLTRFESEDVGKFQSGRTPVGLVIMAHYQPEATSYAEAGLASNHIDVVAMIRALGWTGPIVYREHPAQWAGRRPSRHAGSARTATYYEDLRDLGCIFLSSQVRLDATWLESHRLVPLTMTGSIAIERSVGGHRTLVSGYPWYRGLPGTERLDHRSLAEAENLLVQSQAVADASVSFLRDRLSRTTLTNAPGIGTGVVLDTQAWRAFEEELSTLVEILPEALGDIDFDIHGDGPER
mgnify:CR=1 FL=1